MRTLAHLSDLHLGRGPATAAACSLIVETLVSEGVDQVLVTGDVTDRGRIEELRLFRRLFAPVSDRLVVVPGNHDRLGEDAGRWIQRGRVHAQRLPGLFAIRVDSTAPHNRSPIAAHGLLTPRDIDEVEAVLGGAPEGALVVLMLHHHVHPLPEDGFLERLSTFVGWPNAAHLPLGVALLDRLAGRCDLVLHGHRHAAGELTLGEGSERPLQVLNAGSSPALGRVRLVAHRDGRILARRWVDTAAPGQERAPAAAAAVAA